MINNFTKLIVLSLITLFQAHASYSKFTHCHGRDPDCVQAFCVSKSSTSCFSQQGYTYSFPLCDEDDLDILEDLGKVFLRKNQDGPDTEVPYCSYTKGTYSISIDYNTPEDEESVYRQTKYLVKKDKKQLEKYNTVGISDGRAFFYSRCSSKDLKTLGFPGYGGTYHMENALLTSLYRNKSLFTSIFPDIPDQSQILGVCVKVYSSYSPCASCRTGILKSVPKIRKRFKKRLENSSKNFCTSEELPLMVQVLACRPYGSFKNYETDGDITLDAAYSIQPFNPNEFFRFKGTIIGGPSQKTLPIYLHKQRKGKNIKDKPIHLDIIEHHVN